MAQNGGSGDFVSGTACGRASGLGRRRDGEIWDSRAFRGTDAARAEPNVHPKPGGRGSRPGVDSVIAGSGEITPEEAAELTNQEERRIQIPDWDYGEREGSSLFDRFSFSGIESFLPEEFQRPQGLSDWDWSLRQGRSSRSKERFGKKRGAVRRGENQLNVAKRIRKSWPEGGLRRDDDCGQNGRNRPETGTIRLNARVGGPENLFSTTPCGFWRNRRLNSAGQRGCWRV